MIHGLYALGFSFLLRPVGEFQDGRLSAYLCPMALVTLFYFQTYDVLFMGIHALLLNAYVAYLAFDLEAWIDD